ncbi:MAG TPA: ATP-binding protein [Candidatus Polarisedimenticolaceae bacterium]
MAQWSRADRTLHAKLVYYGPALGGKTTTLRAIHRLTDPEGRNPLLSLATADDRTLFFDLLPFELGSILGYRVALKLYTVPGQVRYDATRRVVLAGADAVVFVADASPGRAADARASWEDLRRNLGANRIEGAGFPILVQANKQDVEGAADAAEVAGWLDVRPHVVRGTSARTGEGVLDVFVAASKAMLSRLVSLADERTRREIDPAQLDRQVEAAFAPYRGRPGPAADAPERRSTIPLDEADLLGSAVRVGTQLGAELADARARGARLEREADALRTLTEMLRRVDATFDRDAIADGALAAAGAVLGAARAEVWRLDPETGPRLERSWGDGSERLAGPEGASFIRALLEAGSTCAADDLACETKGALPRAAFACAPVEGPARRLLAVHVPAPERRFDAADLRFLSTVAGHLAAGFDKAGVWAELVAHRERLEVAVAARTKALARAYEELRSLDRMKDRFLSSVSHEMRTPLTAIVCSASFLRDYGGAPEERREMAENVLRGAGALERLLDGLFRIARLERGGEPLGASRLSVPSIVGRAIELAGNPRVDVALAEDLPAVTGDPDLAPRALANLLDNARKFSPPDSCITLRVEACGLRIGKRTAEAVAFTVLDRGPGVPEADLERLFEAFEQGGETLTAKPAGVGLGLYEARLAARRHGGLLRYTPRAGGGSEFRLVLPAATASADLEAVRG